MENKIILYKDDEGKLSVNVRFADEDVWLTQAQLADIYNTTQQNISLHQKGIYADGELDENATSVVGQHNACTSIYRKALRWMTSD